MLWLLQEVYPRVNWAVLQLPRNSSHGLQLQRGDTAFLVLKQGLITIC